MAVSLVALSAVIALLDAPDSWRPLVEGLRCSTEVASQFDQWQARGVAYREASGPLGTEVFRIPTQSLGIWLTLHRRPETGEAMLYRTDSNGSRGVRFDWRDGCAARSRLVRARPKLPAGGLDDAELARAIVSAKRGLVVYLWSPHMPLSSEGFAQIRSACQELSIDLVSVVDPSADPDFVRRTGDEVGIPPEARRPLASIELTFRNLAVHAPTILVFDGTERVSPLLPGYRNAAAYRRFLQKFLEKAPDERSGR